MFYVYAYLDSSKDDEPFYIGKGRCKRDTEHMWQCLRQKSNQYHTPFYRRLRRLLESGRNPVIIRLADNLNSEQAAFGLESFFILALGRRNDPDNPGPLWNLTNGGEGRSGSKLSDTAKRKIGNANRGRRASKAARAKMSRAHSIRPRDATAIAKAADTLLRRGSGLYRRANGSWFIKYRSKYLGVRSLFCHALAVRQSREFIDDVRMW